MKENSKLSRILYKKDGSITILSALLMSVLVLFFTVLIDLSRILVLHNTSEDQMRLAMMSTLSAYDQQLYERYGLFGRGGTESLALFTQTLEGNQNNAYEIYNTHKPFDLIQGEFNDIEMIAEEYLGEHAVFERQLIADMKYKAPIDFMLELMEEWLPLSNAIETSQQMTKILDELEDLFHEREHWLEQGLSIQKKLGEYVQNSRYYQQIRTSLRSTINGYSSYTSMVRFEASLEEDEESEYEEQILSYIASVQRTVRSIEQTEQAFLDEAVLLAEQSYGYIRKASAINNTIKIKYERYQIENKQSKESQTLAADMAEMNNALGELEPESDDIVRDPAWFTEYERAIEEQKTRISNIRTEAGAIASQLYFEVNHPPMDATVSRQRYNELKDSQQELESRLKEYIQDYDNPGDIIQIWEADLTKNREVKTQLAEEEKQFKELMSEYESIISLFNMKEEYEIAQEEYKEVKQKYDLNLKVNLAIDSAEEFSTNEPKSGRKSAVSSLTMMKGLFQKLEGSMVSIRNHIFMNEYALHHFTTFPMGKLTNELESKTIGAELLQFQEQQVEYIIYGKYEPLQNVLLASGEIFAFRFAIRTIEGIIANRHMVNPLLMVSAAILHGIRLAISDMMNLYREGTTKLSHYIPIDVTYKNYLRLILLLHFGSKERRLSRMIATIEQERGYPLLAVPTALTAQATTSIQLWSAPGVSHLLTTLASKDQVMRGNKYETTQFIEMSY